MSEDKSSPLQYHTESFTALKYPVLDLLFLSSPSLTSIDLYCPYSFAFSRSWAYIICSLFRLAYFVSNMHLQFFHGFHGLIAHSFVCGGVNIHNINLPF